MVTNDHRMIQLSSCLIHLLYHSCSDLTTATTAIVSSPPGVVESGEFSPTNNPASGPGLALCRPLRSAYKEPGILSGSTEISTTKCTRTLLVNLFQSEERYSTDTMSTINNKDFKDLKDDVFIDKLEKVDTFSDEQAELDNIETTAASKAAWLIAMTVSIGGFLFGQHWHQSTWLNHD